MNNIFVSWKQKIESRIISDLKSQYTESEEQTKEGAVFKKAEEDYINRNHSRSSFFGFFDYKSSLFAR